MVFYTLFRRSASCFCSYSRIIFKSSRSYASKMTHRETIKPIVTSDLCSQNFDSVVLVVEDVLDASSYPILSETLQDASQVNQKFSSDIHTLTCRSLPSKRLIVSFTGHLDRDIDDARRITEASTKGLSHAIKIGSKRPLLLLGQLKSAKKLEHPWLEPSVSCLASLLGGFHALYVPLEVRESSPREGSPCTKPVQSQKAEAFGWFAGTHYAVDHEKLASLAWCLEEGLRVARDIGGSDPERMNAKNIVAYLQKELSAPVQMTASPVDQGLYPLAAIVDRGNNEKHRGHVVHLEYNGPTGKEVDPQQLATLFLVGKGVTYDTGGSDLKVNGIMATMHRDKCGAASVAGFFKILNILKPSNLKVHGTLGLVRNSIGENAYVSDEIVTSRAGVRVRVNNTDAEGRMVMTDLLCEAKEKALKVPNPRLLTIATLTGHVGLCYGQGYTGIVCNGPAKDLGEDYNYQFAGSLLGEMHEISTLRREDYDAHKADEEYADLVNSARPIAGKRSRGHQSPVAFMIVASGLDSHLKNSEKPLAYTHLDIASSHGPCPGIPTGTPILTLVSRYILPGQLMKWPNRKL
ncbi:putative aminopeptidase W07G4.4 isoform 1 [Schistosoma japonicum]|uniref:Putative aminopeptidase W07G4.4 isoform 1 n=1 Tax=Schistosoma japonicum TaxID=6182 RepID=A0A4Z2CZG5_SCHJA|nr:aminopeptidase W07G4.4 [Schistosoma japonicum]TNN09528.1 putative aminopeptidase W07G4.4 isoform 1 [Schistosoma japonicum]